MDGAPTTSGSGGGGGGGPAPLLMKTYDVVDDSTTDEIVSWSQNKTSFVVWNPPEFARVLLPAFFKHNNFSSFIRQLNTILFQFLSWMKQREETLKILLDEFHKDYPSWRFYWPYSYIEGESKCNGNKDEVREWEIL